VTVSIKSNAKVSLAFSDQLSAFTFLFNHLDSIIFFSSPTEVPAVWIKAQWPRAYGKRF
jgi:hypothetical protein